jgi:hypothetical protein
MAQNLPGAFLHRGAEFVLDRRDGMSGFRREYGRRQQHG